MQGEEIANIISGFKEGQYMDNAVLYRTNMEARSLIDTFTRRKIPFVLLDKGYNFFNHFISKDIIKGNTAFADILKVAIDDSYKRLIEPSIEREIRNDLTERAEEKAIKVFGKNAKQLLLRKPNKGTNCNWI